MGLTTSLAIAAEVLGISYTTARSLANAGRFPVPTARPGRVWIVPVAGLVRFLEGSPAEPVQRSTEPVAAHGLDHHRAQSVNGRRSAGASRHPTTPTGEHM